ncbi:hypothetical protein KAFR_0L00805 [Kazachstania africana CBS 2517]|uniref:Uncharacterized protein n=1 Tax=Kazachstania africana (strain ATCC 22294 / BCRC 22015 / CBS 2517 / CECT 1963 / NBRC 1671 / NRRL Y-8276) TaxID=1071382 RepID=H2B238_KAZAF|nr:hypothetical protein KAFR_0L00805 [Kazachstania africana CBS 2517]CCF60688.1 hypothetical protein KAFR_0L00805 [Kazachstania africana CBS 2517]
MFEDSWSILNLLIVFTAIYYKIHTRMNLKDVDEVASLKF